MNYKSEVEQLFSELKSTQEKMKADTDALLKQKEDRVVEAMTKTMEASQNAEAKAKAIEEAEQKLNAALERMEAGNFGGAKSDDKFNEEYKSAFRSYARTGNEMDLKALSEGVETEGGYAVRPELLNMLITRVFETSPVRQVANVMTVGTSDVDILIDDQEFGAGRTAEKGSRPTTDNAEFGMDKIFLKEYYAKPRATQRFLDDTYLDAEAWIARKASDKISRLENSDFINGDGVAGARGILSYSAWAANGTYERNALERINSGSNGTFTVNGLIDLQASLKEDYQSNAVWMINRTAFGEIMKLSGSNNYHFLGLQPTDRQNAVFGNMTLLGKPVMFASDLVASTDFATGSDAAIYGDFRQGYTVLDHRLGLRVLRDPYSSKPFVEFYTTKRTGGDVTSFDSLKIQKLSA